MITAGLMERKILTQVRTSGKYQTTLNNKHKNYEMPKTKCWDTEADANSALPDWLQIIKGDYILSEKSFYFNRGSIGKAVRDRRKASGLSLRACATWVGVSHTHLSNLELGKKPWSASRLQDVTDVLSMHERSTN